MQLSRKGPLGGLPPPTEKTTPQGVLALAPLLEDPDLLRCVRLLMNDAGQKALELPDALGSLYLIKVCALAVHLGRLAVCYCCNRY